MFNFCTISPEHYTQSALILKDRNQEKIIIRLEMHPKLYCLLLITFHEIMSKAFLSWLERMQFHDLCILNAELLMISRQVTLERQLGAGRGETAVDGRMPAPRPSTLQRSKEKNIAIFVFFIPRAIKASVSLQTRLKGQNTECPLTYI